VLENLFHTLENSDLAIWVKSSPSIFAYTAVLTAHAIGLAIVVGCSTVVALRLLGKARSIPLTALESLYGYIWFGFFINLISGILLFIPEATSQAKMIAFQGKILLIIVGMIVGQLLRVRYFRDTASVNAGVVTPIGRKLAITSLVVWYLALIVGRLTGYPDLVQSWFGI
jgi:hypothetical protein